jgi:hypothetical protein
MKAAKLLLDQGTLPASLVDDKNALRVIAAATIVEALGRLRTEDPLPVLRLFLRAAAKVSERSQPTAAAMLDRLCHVASGDAADNLRRLVHEERAEGSEQIARLDTSPAALRAADKVGL